MKANRELNAAEVLERCEWGVPVNVSMEAAIEAHRSATQSLCGFALRAVILARTPEVSDLQCQIDYLAGLPGEAWDALECDPDARSLTLDAIRRQIAWMQNR
jgi:hypothetical protein